MHIKRFDRAYSRRHFLSELAQGVLRTGVLLPLWPTLAAKGSAEGVYPDELLSLTAYTQGAIQEGDTINADNVESVRELLTRSSICRFLKWGVSSMWWRPRRTSTG